MNILYLHGLDSSPNLEKIGLIEDLGHKVNAPKIDYRAYFDSLNLFWYMVELIEKTNINFIIGSSMGGYLGFFLSEYTKVKSILYNPALIERSKILPVENIFNNIEKKLLVGKMDDIIPYQVTEEFIRKGKYTNSEIIELQIGHNVPIHAFQFGLGFLC